MNPQRRVPPKRVRAAAFAALLALLLAACGGNGNGGGGGSPPAGQNGGGGSENGSGGEDPGDDDHAAAREFYDGEQMTLVVAFGEGGGADLVARALVPYLTDFLGVRNILVENQPGGGQLLAANSIYSGEDSGLTLGFFSGQGLVASVLGGAEGVSFEIGEYTGIAGLGGNPRVLAVGGTSGLETFEDVMEASPFIFASAGPGGSDHTDIEVLRAIFDLDVRIITGYAGSAETELSVIAGDTQGNSGAYASRSGAIDAGDLIPVLAIMPDRNPNPDVPSLLEFDMSEEGEALAIAHLAMGELGRAVLGAPGIPDERAAFLRAAFESAMTDPAFLADLEQIRQEVNWMSGEQLEGEIQMLLDAPELYVNLMKESLGG